MAKRNDVLVTGSAETVIGSGVVAKGSLVSDNDILVDGSFTGDIKAGGNVTLGVNASVTGNIRATNVTVGGELTGDIKALEEATITESGHVAGDITSGGIAIAQGAVFNGTVKMTAPAAPRPLAEPEPGPKA